MAGHSKNLIGQMLCIYHRSFEGSVVFCQYFRDDPAYARCKDVFLVGGWFGEPKKGLTWERLKHFVQSEELKTCKGHATKWEWQGGRGVTGVFLLRENFT